MNTSNIYKFMTFTLLHVLLVLPIIPPVYVPHQTGDVAHWQLFVLQAEVK